MATLSLRKKPHPIEALMGHQIVIQARKGSIYKGTLVSFQDEFATLSDAEIIGKNQSAQTQTVSINIANVSHYHPANGVVLTDNVAEIVA